MEIRAKGSMRYTDSPILEAAFQQHLPLAVTAQEAGRESHQRTPNCHVSQDPNRAGADGGQKDVCARARSQQRTGQLHRWGLCLRSRRREESKEEVASLSFLKDLAGECGTLEFPYPSNPVQVFETPTQPQRDQRKEVIGFIETYGLSAAFGFFPPLMEQQC